MLHRLCEPPSIPLSFSLATVLPRRCTQCFCAGSEGVKPPPRSAHRLGPGLPGYLIPFAPLAFAPQRQDLTREPPSPLAFRCISTHFTATCTFRSPLQPSSLAVSKAVPRLSRGITPLTYQTAYAPFKPSDTEQRSHHPYYRGCWHGFSRCFLSRFCQPGGVLPHPGFITRDRILQPRRPSSSTRRRMFTLSRIDNYSELQPPVGVWAVSQSQCGRSPSQAGYPSSPW